MQFRIRSKLLSANLQLVILSALRWRPMSNWELLDEIYSRTGLMPEDAELKRTIRLLVDGGFVQVPSKDSQSRMTINARGIELLSELAGLQQGYFESTKAWDRNHG